MSRIAIIGAAGYVGLHLVQTLEEAGHDIVAVARTNGRLLLSGRRIKLLSPEHVAEAGRVDCVINLAYPNTGSIYHYSLRNKEILERIAALVGDTARIVHVSTIAVFGLSLEHQQNTSLVSRRRDYLYIESKIEFEHLLAGRFKGRDLHIVRLGNVWGPASPVWTAEIARRLQFGEPVGIMGRDGYSNTTDVANVASYLAYLAGIPPAPGIRFSHLAEMSETRWSFWVRKLSDVLGLEAFYESSHPAYYPTLMKETMSMIRDVSPLAIARKMIWGRFTGSLVRSAVRMLPVELYSLLKSRKKRSGVTPGHSISQSDHSFLTVVSCPKQFMNLVDSKWVPPVSVDQSWDRVQQWMAEAGYNEKVLVGL